MKWSATALLLTLLCALQSVHAGTAEFGIRFIVDDLPDGDGTERQAIADRLAAHVEEINGYYRDSEVVLRAVVVDIDFVELDVEEAVEILDRMRREQGAFPDLFRRSEELGADYTIAVTRRLRLGDRIGCGRAYAVNKTIEQISSTYRRLAVVNPVCGAHTLAHELGHLMGLNHGVQVDRCRPGMGHTTALTPYALGYAEGNCDGEPQEGAFGTIMVGGWMGAITGDWSSRGSLRIYSNPRVRDPRCGTSGICGDPKIGDAARTLNEHAHLYANSWKRCSDGVPEPGPCVSRE